MHTGGDDIDLWGSLEFWLTLCGDLADMTPADYREAAYLARGMSPAAVPPLLAPLPAEEVRSSLDCDGYWWELIDHASRLIAAHWDLEYDRVLDELLKHDIDGIPWHGGTATLSDLLLTPMGWMMVGLVVVQDLTGLDLNTLPPGRGHLFQIQ